MFCKQRATRGRERKGRGELWFDKLRLTLVMSLNKNLAHRWCATVLFLARAASSPPRSRFEVSGRLTSETSFLNNLNLLWFEVVFEICGLEPSTCPTSVCCEFSHLECYDQSFTAFLNFKGGWVG